MIGPDDPVPLAKASIQSLRTRLAAELLRNSGPSLKRAEAIKGELARRDKPPERKKDGFVYFLRCGKRVKIGFTSNPEARLRSLSTGAPEHPVMLMWKPGTEAMEKQLHWRFSAFRVHREWFSLHGALLRFLRKEGCDV